MFFFKYNFKNRDSNILATNANFLKKFKFFHELIFNSLSNLSFQLINFYVTSSLMVKVLFLWFYIRYGSNEFSMDFNNVCSTNNDLTHNNWFVVGNGFFNKYFLIIFFILVFFNYFIFTYIKSCINFNYLAILIFKFSIYSMVVFVFSIQLTWQCSYSIDWQVINFFAQFIFIIIIFQKIIPNNFIFVKIFIMFVIVFLVSIYIFEFLHFYNFCLAQSMDEITNPDVQYRHRQADDFNEFKAKLDYFRKTNKVLNHSDFIWSNRLQAYETYYGQWNWDIVMFFLFDYENFYQVNKLVSSFFIFVFSFISCNFFFFYVNRKFYVSLALFGGDVKYGTGATSYILYVFRVFFSYIFQFYFFVIFLDFFPYYSGFFLDFEDFGSQLYNFQDYQDQVFLLIDFQSQGPYENIFEVLYIYLDKIIRIYIFMYSFWTYYLVVILTIQHMTQFQHDQFYPQFFQVQFESKDYGLFNYNQQLKDFFQKIFDRRFYQSYSRSIIDYYRYQGVNGTLINQSGMVFFKPFQNYRNRLHKEDELYPKHESIFQEQFITPYDYSVFQEHDFINKFFEYKELPEFEINNTRILSLSYNQAFNLRYHKFKSYEFEYLFPYYGIDDIMERQYKSTGLEQSFQQYDPADVSQKINKNVLHSYGFINNQVIFSEFYDSMVGRYNNYHNPSYIDRKYTSNYNQELFKVKQANMYNLVIEEQYFNLYYEDFINRVFFSNQYGSNYQNIPDSAELLNNNVNYKIGSTHLNLIFKSKNQNENYLINNVSSEFSDQYVRQFQYMYTSTKQFSDNSNRDFINILFYNIFIEIVEEIFLPIVSSDINIFKYFKYKAEYKSLDIIIKDFIDMFIIEILKEFVIESFSKNDFKQTEFFVKLVFSNFSSFKDSYNDSFYNNSIELHSQCINIYKQFFNSKFVTNNNFDFLQFNVQVFEPYFNIFATNFSNNKSISLLNFELNNDSTDESIDQCYKNSFFINSIYDEGYNYISFVRFNPLYLSYTNNGNIIMNRFSRYYFDVISGYSKTFEDIRLISDIFNYDAFYQENLYSDYNYKLDFITQFNEIPPVMISDVDKEIESKNKLKSTPQFDKNYISVLADKFPAVSTFNILNTNYDSLYYSKYRANSDLKNNFFPSVSWIDSVLLVSILRKRYQSNKYFVEYFLNDSQPFETLITSLLKGSINYDKLQKSIFNINSLDSNIFIDMYYLNYNMIINNYYLKYFVSSNYKIDFFINKQQINFKNYIIFNNAQQFNFEKKNSFRNINGLNTHLLDLYEFKYFKSPKLNLIDNYKKFGLRSQVYSKDIYFNFMDIFNFQNTVGSSYVGVFSDQVIYNPKLNVAFNIFNTIINIIFKIFNLFVFFILFFFKISKFAWSLFKYCIQSIYDIFLEDFESDYQILLNFKNKEYNRVQRKFNAKWRRRRTRILDVMRFFSKNSFSKNQQQVSDNAKLSDFEDIIDSSIMGDFYENFYFFRNFRISKEWFNNYFKKFH